MSFDRTLRINEEIKKIISQVIMLELKDPAISSLTTVSAVETTRDLRYCTVYISVYDKVKNPNQTIKALERAKGYIRRQIGKELNLRYTPEPKFKLDSSIDYAGKINKILNDLKKEK